MKTSFFLVFFVTIIMATGCKVTIPERDSINPTLFFQSSKGLPNFMIKSEDVPSAFDTKALQLARNVEYSAIFGCNDAGGIKEATMEIPGNGIFEIEEPLPSGWSIIAISDTPTGTRTIRWLGNSMDARNATLLPITFTPKTSSPTSTEAFEITFTAKDYKDNTTTRRLTVRVGGGPAALIDL